MKSYGLSLDQFRDELRRCGMAFADADDHIGTTCPSCPGEITAMETDAGIIISCSQCDCEKLADDLTARDPTTRVSTVEQTTQVVQLGALEAGQQLAELLGLTAAGMVVRSARLTGNGARASAQIEISNGEWMEFEMLRDLGKPAILRAELAACAGVTPKITTDDAMRAIGLLRIVARRQQSMTEDDHAIDWGVSYLQAAQDLAVDIADQADRWEAFSNLRALDNARDESGTGQTLVLIGTDGRRYVRAGHFFPWVRKREPGMSEGRMAQRMLRVGWSRRGQSGRIKATQPGMGDAIGWSFFIVPADWPGSEVPTGVEVMRARGDQPLSRVAVGTGRNLGTDAEVAA